MILKSDRQEVVIDIALNGLTRFDILQFVMRIIKLNLFPVPVRYR